MLSNIVTLVLISLLCQSYESVSVSQYTKTKIKMAVEYFLKEGCCKTILCREWPSALPLETRRAEIEHYTTPGILIWNVLRSYGSVIGRLMCPFCAEDQESSVLLHSGLWADGSVNCRYEPRVIYDTSACILLVSAVYICPKKHQVPSHHPSILSALPSSSFNLFYLTNRAGFTIEFLSQISSLVDCGTSFHGIEGIVREQYEQSYWRLRLRFEEDRLQTETKCADVFPPFSQDTYPYPHEKIIKQVFISYSMLFLSKFNENMACRTSLWISCDHTFKSAANIGFYRESDGSWVRLFRCVFCVMGDKGDVLHWRFTRGEAFEEVSEIFLDLKVRFDSRGLSMQGIIIDNCCKWRGMFSSILPGVPVKLDLFHAVQRFLSVLPKEVRVQTGIAKEYGMIFRHSSDLGESRQKNTPDVRTIMKNLESFEKKWSVKKFKEVSVLNIEAKKAISNLKFHIQKGCLSDIPPHCSTSRNERLHRELNYILHSNKLGLDMAYVRCSRLFFKNNNKNCSLASKLCCPDKESSCSFNATQSFGVGKAVSVQNTQSAMLGNVKSLQQLQAAEICKIKRIISGTIECSQSTFDLDEHGYSSCSARLNETALHIALDALSFYDIYNGLKDLGFGRFLSKTKLPSSIGLGGVPLRQLSSVSSAVEGCGDSDFINSVLAGHLEAFGLQHIPIAGDGNCFFSAVSLQLASLMSSRDTPRSMVGHINNFGITHQMSVAEIAKILRMLLVQEWRGHRAEEYRNFLSAEFDYYSEITNYEQDRYFGGALGDLMPIAMSNILLMPLVIVTSEPHTPLISVCPSEPILHSTPLFLAYNSLGVGHYDAVISKRETSESINPEQFTTQTQLHKKEQSKRTLKSGQLTKRHLCRCGEGSTKHHSPKRKYFCKNRCSCLCKYKGCARGCKCVGRCGGTQCKKVLVTPNKKKRSLKKKSKHLLQTTPKRLPTSNGNANGFTLNFLELCVLSAIIQQMRNSHREQFSWNVDRINDMYLLVISSLLNLGISLPINPWTKTKIGKEVLKLKKFFEDN